MEGNEIVQWCNTDEICIKHVSRLALRFLSNELRRQAYQDALKTNAVSRRKHQSWTIVKTQDFAQCRRFLICYCSTCRPEVPQEKAQLGRDVIVIEPHDKNKNISAIKSE